MKLLVRFICFFTAGLFLFLIYMGVLTAFVFELIVPYFNISERYEFMVFLIVFVFTFISGGLILGRFFVKPLLHILKAINRLSIGNYDLSEINDTMYQHKKLKKKYYLYQEVLADLTLLAQSLNEAKLAREHLERSKQNWISGISHDLKTPLAYIVGYSALLLNEEYNWTKQESTHYLSEIYTKGNYIEELIQDLNLTFKIDSMKTTTPFTPEPFDLVGFMQNLIADTANNPNASSYDFSFQSTQPLLLIYADKKLLYRAFQNLLNNAINHNEKGTKVDASIYITKSNEIAIDIADNGNGLDKEILDRIFMEYYQAEDKSNYTKGVGLGLSIVKRIIEIHQGTLTVTSTPDQGCIFHTVLPLSHKNYSS